MVRNGTIYTILYFLYHNGIIRLDGTKRYKPVQNGTFQRNDCEIARCGEDFHHEGVIYIFHLVRNQ